MRKTLVALLVAGAPSLAAISPSAAQSSEEALVKVPFPFITADKLMPAGTYLVSGETGDWSVVRIASVDGKMVAIVRAKNTAVKPVAGIQPRFWFTNYHGHYFLQRLWMPFLDVREVPLTKAEAERTLTRLNLMHQDVGDPAK